jgi:hypothetical protein
MPDSDVNTRNLSIFPNFMSILASWKFLKCFWRVSYIAHRATVPLGKDVKESAPRAVQRLVKGIQLSKLVFLLQPTTVAFLAELSVTAS